MAERRAVSRRLGEWGAAFPSPVVMLSIIAVVMAGVAFVVTRHQPVTEREITPVAAPSSSASSSGPADQPSSTPSKPAKPPVQRGKVYVEVYNNSNIQGLAGKVGDKAAGVGWQVVGTDNWYGTIPASTVYFPPRLERAARQLSLDLGIRRTMPAVAPMRMDRLTVILTSDAA
ncbi:MAG: LytR C-terminal domain-containing protein [Nocardioidaceae bacterium]